MKVRRVSSPRKLRNTSCFHGLREREPELYDPEAMEDRNSLCSAPSVLVDSAQVRVRRARVRERERQSP